MNADLPRPTPGLLMKTTLRTLLAAFTLSAAAATAHAQNGPLPGQVKAQSLSHLPLTFIENRGQMHADVGYCVNGDNTVFYFTPRGVTISLIESQTILTTHHRGKKGLAREEESPQGRQRWTLNLDFVGANPHARPVALQQRPGVVSYFKGPREQWKTGLKTYGKVRYPNLWHGIDMEYSGAVNRLKYTFVLKPGANPEQIQFRCHGATGVATNATGQLEIATPLGTLLDDRPTAYQDINGQHVPVSIEYALDASGSGAQTNHSLAKGFHFNVGAYDRTRPLIIDPTVFVVSLLGGVGQRGLGIAVDAAGSAYVCGQVLVFDGYDSFPVTVGPDLVPNGRDDAYIAKLSPDGSTLLYLGYIGGTNRDGAFAVQVDPNGNAYVCGFAQSSETSFPVVGGPDLHFHGGTVFGGSDAFIAKVDPAGTNLVYCGYIGGTGDETAENLALDDFGNAYVTGPTTSDEASFPVVVGPDLTHNGRWDTYVAKVRANPTNAVVTNNFAYCGYIGGAGDDAGAFYEVRNGVTNLVEITAGSIAVDEAGFAYVCSYTDSGENTFPNGSGFASLSIPGLDQTFNGGAYDSYVAKIKDDGSGLVYCTYLGGAGFDGGTGVAVDPQGNAYVCGFTASSEATFPVIGGPDLHHHPGGDLNVDAFVAKLNALGTALVYCGYIGGPLDDAATNLRVDTNGVAYVVGQTESDQTTFPVVNGPDLTFNGMRDAFIAKVKSNPTDAVVTNNFEYCGYVGGESIDAGFDIAFDGFGNAYICGDAYGTFAAFVAKISLGASDFPPNDDFDHATVITSLPFTARQNNLFATTAPDDPNGCYGIFCWTLRSTLWYSFTPTRDMWVEINQTFGKFWIYTGTRGALSEIPDERANAHECRFKLNAKAGVTYNIVAGIYFGIFGPQSLPGDGVFSIRELHQPPNDDFDNATRVTALPFTNQVNVTDATRALDDPSPTRTFPSMLDFPGIGTVWYAFTPPRDMRVEVRMSADDTAEFIEGDAQLAIYTGSRGALAEVPVNFFGCNFDSLTARLDLRAGTTYYFYVIPSDSLFCDAVGNLGFSLAEITVSGPLNDYFENSTIVGALPFTHRQSTMLAGRTTDDPPLWDCNLPWPTLEETVWYQFTPARDMRVELNTLGSDYDTVVAVFTGARGVLESKYGRCNNDICDPYFWMYCPNCSGTNLQSRIKFDVKGGVTYYIMVGSLWCPVGGNLAFNLFEVLTINLDPTAIRNPDGSVTLSGTFVSPIGYTGGLDAVVTHPSGCQPIFHTNSHNPDKVTYPCTYLYTFGNGINFEGTGQPTAWRLTTVAPLGNGNLVGGGWADVWFWPYLSAPDECGYYVPDDQDRLLGKVFIRPFPSLKGITRHDNEVTLAWDTTPGQRYRVQYKEDLKDTEWRDLPGVVVGDGETASHVDAVGGLIKRFYRVIEVR